MQTPSSKSFSGFTLLELLLSMAVIAVIASFSVPAFHLLQVKNDLTIATNTIVQTLNRAQILSQAVDGDSSWGVKAQSGLITLFKGTSFASRDASFDEHSSVPSTITFSGTSEYVFSKMTGYPVATGTATLTSTYGDTSSVSVNGKGVVSY